MTITRLKSYLIVLTFHNAFLINKYVFFCQPLKVKSIVVKTTTIRKKKLFNEAYVDYAAKFLKH